MLCMAVLLSTTIIFNSMEECDEKSIKSLVSAVSIVNSFYMENKSEKENFDLNEN